MLKKFLIIFLIYSKTSFCEEIIAISKENDKDAPVDKPTVVVDIFGNTTWKYPVGFFDPPKVEPKKIDNQNKKEPYLVINSKPFMKGKNEKYTIYAGYSVMGSMNGPELGFGYSKNYLTHNIELNFYNQTTWQVEDVNNIQILKYKLEYHAFPQWYINNLTKKPIDAGLAVSLGYGKNENSNVSETSLNYGIGGFLKYPLTVNSRINVNINKIEGGNTISYGSTVSIGIGFDF